MKKSLGFTLAEVLITLAIIGVVAAMTIPSVIVNTNQAEFRTGFKKAVSVLNSAISMNTAIDGESPADNDDLYTYLQKNMSITEKHTGSGTDKFSYTNNAGFYTTDGIRFEFPTETIAATLHNDNAVTFGGSQGTTAATNRANKMGNCGSAGLSDLGGDDAFQPCLVIVDVNGMKKPNPTNDVQTVAANAGKYTYAHPGERLIKDVFPILVTDQKAIPYGVIAQQTMYEAK